MSPTPQESITTTPAVRASETLRSVDLAGAGGAPIRASVVESGNGPRTIFLHGLVGLNEHWELVIERMEDRARCTRLELPLLDLDGSDCSVQGVEALTVQFLESHVGEPAVLVGNSFGGHVALRIAIHRPDLVRALVLAGSSGLFERTLVKGAPLHPSRAWITEKIAELFHDKSKVSEEDVDRAHAVLNTRTGKRAMIKLSRTARRNNLHDRIREIACPSLLIWGRQDIVTPPSAAEGFRDLMPDARLVWVDECGHTPMLEAPDVFSGALRRFLDELDGRRA
ncbi:MAG: alpha/beta hydrolase [Planctomycetota bacterium]